MHVLLILCFCLPALSATSTALRLHMHLHAVPHSHRCGTWNLLYQQNNSCLYMDCTCQPTYVSPCAGCEIKLDVCMLCACVRARACMCARACPSLCFPEISNTHTRTLTRKHSTNVIYVYVHVHTCTCHRHQTYTHAYQPACVPTVQPTSHSYRSTYLPTYIRSRGSNCERCTKHL